MYQLQIPDTLRARNESVADTQYTIHLKAMWHENSQTYQIQNEQKCH